MYRINGAALQNGFCIHFLEKNYYCGKIDMAILV